MSKEWDAKTYHAVSSPQFAWGLAVLDRVPLRGDEDALDAGCGTGRLTVELAKRLPRGIVVAADRSENMIEEAKKTLAVFGDHVRFHAGDLLELPFDRAFDLVFSTATFHWVLDHERLFRRLHAALRPGGSLVAQCGGAGNLAAFLRRAARVVEAPRYAPYFEGWRDAWYFAEADVTRARLERAGFEAIDTNLQPAPTPFPDAPSFRRFIENVVLRHHVERLPEREIVDAFLDDVVASGPAELDYVRLNVRATRPEARSL